MKPQVLLLTALSVVAALSCGSPAIAAVPPVCDVVECTPPEFPTLEKEYGCPKSTRFNSPVNAQLECIPTSQHSLTCMAYPFEVNVGTCGGSGENLTYDWSVTVGMDTYPYPPSYDNTISVSCMARERVSVTVTVWNGMYSSSSNFGMRCGDMIQ